MRCMSQLRCRCHNRPGASFAHGAGRRPSSKGCLQAPCCIDGAGRQPAHFCATPHDSFWQILLQKPSSTLLHLWCAAKDRLSDPDWLPSRNRVPEDPPREMLFYVFAEQASLTLPKIEDTRGRQHSYVAKSTFTAIGRSCSRTQSKQSITNSWVTACGKNRTTRSGLLTCW